MTHAQPEDTMSALKPNTSKTDENVRIPAAVKANIARVEALHAAAYPKPAEAAPPATPQAPSNPLEAPSEPPIAASPPAAPSPPAEAPPVTPAGNDDWEGKYKSMKGRYDRLQPQVKSLSDEIASLRGVIATMNAAPSPAAPAPAAQQRLVTPQEETDFGAEFLDVVARRAKETFAPVEADLKAQIDDLKSQVGRVGGSVQLNARERMFSAFDAAVPSWKEINVDPNFLSWLALPDAYSGVIRHKLLSAAWEQNETPRALAFFNGFLAEEAAVAPEPRVPDVAPGITPAAKVPLESFAAPGRAKSAAGERTPAEKPIISRAQISQFYIDSTAGKYRGRDDEKNRIEKMIFDAQGDGRIR